MSYTKSLIANPNGGRKRLLITMGTDAGRDAAKQYLIEEMDAFRAEAWATRAIMGAASSGIDLANMDKLEGMMGLYVLVNSGIKGLAGMPWHVAKELMDEMLGTIKIMPAAANGDANMSMPLTMGSENVSEIKTLVDLRKEWFELHTGFSLADVLSPLTSATLQQPNSSTTTTSQLP